MQHREWFIILVSRLPNRSRNAILTSHFDKSRLHQFEYWEGNHTIRANRPKRAVNHQPHTWLTWGNRPLCRDIWTSCQIHIKNLPYDVYVYSISSRHLMIIRYHIKKKIILGTSTYLRLQQWWGPNKQTDHPIRANPMIEAQKSPHRGAFQEVEELVEHTAPTIFYMILKQMKRKSPLISHSTITNQTIAHSRRPSKMPSVLQKSGLGNRGDTIAQETDPTKTTANREA